MADVAAPPADAPPAEGEAPPAEGEAPPAGEVVPEPEAEAVWSKPWKAADKPVSLLNFS